MAKTVGLVQPLALEIKLNGTSQGLYNGSSSKVINITPDNIGAAQSSHGTHVDYGTNTTYLNYGMSMSPGTSLKVSREDHVHATPDTYPPSSHIHEDYDRQFTYLESDITNSINMVKEDISRIGSDIVSHTHTPEEIRAAAKDHTHSGYFNITPGTNSIPYFRNGWFGVKGTNGSAIIGFSTYIQSPVTYSNTYPQAPNMVIESIYGNICRSTSSSKRYKRDISEDLSDDLDPNKLYDIPVKQFKYNKGYITSKPDDDTNYIGFIVEDIEKIYPIAVDYNGNGTPEMWNFKIMIPAMLQLIKNQKNKLEENNIIISDLVSRIEALESLSK